MHFLDVNLIPVIVAAFVYIGIGMFWYSPKAFGPQWLKATKRRPDEMKNGGQTLGLAILNSIVISFVLAHFVKAANATTWTAGACVGLWAWVGFVATTHFSGMIWEKRPGKLFAIDVSAALIGLVVIGSLLAAWK